MPLSNDVLNKLLALSSKSGRKVKRNFMGLNDPEGIVSDENWMSPLNKIVWLKAFRAKETLVTIRDGRTFIVNYDTGYTGLDGEQLIHVKPANGDGPLVPRGYFPLRDVTHMQWLKEQH